jgi:hypothetical protein
VAIHNAGNGWRYLPVKGVAFSEGDTDGNNRGAQMFIPVVLQILRRAALHCCQFIDFSTPLLFAFCDVGNAAGTTQQQAYPKSVRYFDDMTVLQHNRATSQDCLRLIYAGRVC